VGRLGAGIAHEVGNPLGAIMGYLGLLARNLEPSQRELVDAAERETRRIDRIVRGLLDFARPREAAVQAIDAAGVVADTLDLVRNQGHFNRLNVDQEVGAGLLVHGDPYQLQQVLVNLLVNAADAVAGVPDARITVRVERRAVRPVPPHRPARRKGDPDGIDYSHRRRLTPPTRFRTGDPAPESGEVVEISVADNGPGVPPDMIDKIFEPFVTTKEPGKGTGLGLALCVRLIEGMGGTVNAANRDGGGAVFSVVMPALPAATSDASLAPADASHHA
jgi:two-component system, NtrC family, sensor kinase